MKRFLDYNEQNSALYIFGYLSDKMYTKPIGTIYRLCTT